MKKLFILVSLIFILGACTTNQPVRYASSSPEIDIYKAMFKSYLAADWDSFRKCYADSSKFLYNATKGNEMSLDDVIEFFKEERELFSSIHYIQDEDFFEMVVTDENETWVNYWGVWSGIMRANEQIFELPVHMTAQFLNGKIVLEHGYWNDSEIEKAIGELQELNQVAE